MALLSKEQVQDLIVHPNEVYHGRSYGTLAIEFMNWLVQYNPDNQSLRDVFFLRGVDFTGYTSSLNAKFVKIGNDALQIYSDQAIFVPIIVSFGDRIHHTNLDTPAKRRDYVNQIIQMGDDPPRRNQLSIDGVTPDITWLDHRIMTEDFNLEVPQPVPGGTLGQTLDVPLNIAGISETVVGGYFVLLKPLPVGKHIIASFGAGDSGYRNRTLVELNVVNRGITLRQPSLFPSEMKDFTSIVEEKRKSKELSNEEADLFAQVIHSLEASKADMQAFFKPTK